MKMKEMWGSLSTPFLRGQQGPAMVSKILSTHPTVTWAHAFLALPLLFDFCSSGPSFI